MTSYQVMCSVTRPPEPTSMCLVTQFQDKAQHHINSVFQDHVLICGKSSQQTQHSNSEDGPDADPAQLKGDELMLCALVSKTSASFSGRATSKINFFVLLSAVWFSAKCSFSFPFMFSLCQVLS